MSISLLNNSSAINAYNILTSVNDQMAKSQQRLSTGKKLTTDGPADLVISKQFESQISGINAALKNVDNATNLVKTAESSMDEMNKLLDRAKTLSLSSMDGTKSSVERTANNQELQNIIESITRIADTTKFGSKNLLNGDMSSNKTNSPGLVQSFSAGGIDKGTYDVVVGTAGVKSSVAAAAIADASAVGIFNGATDGSELDNTDTFKEDAVISITDGTTVLGQVNVKAGDTMQDALNAINGEDTDINVSMNNTDGTINITSNNHGSYSNGFKLQIDSNGFTAESASLANGIDASATVDGITITSDNGLTLSGSNGSKSISLTLAESGNTATTHSDALTISNGATFQIGGNVGDTVNVSISKMDASSLGLSGIGIGSITDAENALTAINSAIDTVSSERGRLGGIQSATFESTRNTLLTSKENLTNALSTVQDIDVAQEMQNFQNLQIRSQVSTFMLSSANQQQGSILSLLG